MTVRRRHPLRAALVAAGIVTIMVAIAGPAFAQARAAVRLATPTDEGRFEGTWAYVNRDAKMAIWLRDTEDGPPEIKYRYLNTTSREEFETDWSGRAEYYVSGQRALFEIALTGGDRNRASGTWTWVVQFTNSGREERGHFTMYRGADGRRLVLHFDEFERSMRRAEDVRTSSPKDHGMTFVKASKRLVLWDELPF